MSKIVALSGAGAVAVAWLSAGASGSDHGARAAGHGGMLLDGLGAYKGPGASSGSGRLLKAAGARAPGWASAGAGALGSPARKTESGGNAADVCGAPMALGAKLGVPGWASAGAGTLGSPAGNAGSSGNAANPCGAPAALGAALGISVDSGMLSAGSSARGGIAGNPGSGGRLTAASGASVGTTGTMVGSGMPATAAGGIAWEAPGASDPSPTGGRSKTRIKPAGVSAADGRPRVSGAGDRLGSIAAAPGASGRPSDSCGGIVTGSAINASGGVPMASGAVLVSDRDMLSTGGSLVACAAEGAGPGLGHSVSSALSAAAGAGGRDAVAASGCTGKLSGSSSAVMGNCASMAGANA